MRYRPFGASGAAISTLTLSLGIDSLTRGVHAANALIYTALESGINAYRLETADPVLAEVVGQALANVDRKLLNVSLQLGTGDGRRGSSRDFSAEGMTGCIDRALNVSGLAWIDVALLEEPGENELSQSSLAALKALRTAGRIRALGVSGETEVMDAYVSTGAFDVLATPFHVNADWRIRSRIREARERDMAILAYDYFPAVLDAGKTSATLRPPKKGLFGFGSGGRSKDEPLAAPDTFAFLHRTPRWTAEAICLAHAMSDPSICSVIVRATDAARLDVLAAVPERDMPPGLSAQIEMARVAA
ncbi:oxidoreductase [Brevundimonas sp. LM2]|uniref:aldo/keto reductase n=1 Tax=Brevundimonas sp. LM2 TaxID=1938605 RepID=UPI000983D6D5|nr:aldo/keto reductase [Brevundimonas sp. LM2]AQR61088.1 oxidoreductase [Brevundimonas sp. LM2]